MKQMIRIKCHDGEYIVSRDHVMAIRSGPSSYSHTPNSSTIVLCSKRGGQFHLNMSSRIENLDEVYKQLKGRQPYQKETQDA